MDNNKTKRMQEILKVKELGEKIGYGNMMDIASALWAIRATQEFRRETIAYVPAMESCMKKEAWNRTRKEILMRMEEIKGYGI